MVNEKASIIIEIMNKVDTLQACGSNYHECTLTDEVENYKKRNIVFDKEELIIKKTIKTKEILRKYTLKIYIKKYAQHRSNLWKGH